MSKVHLHVSLVGLSHPFTCILCRTAGATDSSSNWKNVTCAKCLKKRPRKKRQK